MRPPELVHQRRLVLERPVAPGAIGLAQRRREHMKIGRHRTARKRHAVEQRDQFRGQRPDIRAGKRSTARERGVDLDLSHRLRNDLQPQGCGRRKHMQRGDPRQQQAAAAGRSQRAGDIASAMQVGHQHQQAGKIGPSPRMMLHDRARGAMHEARVWRPDPQQPRTLQIAPGLAHAARWRHGRLRRLPLSARGTGAWP